MNCGKLPDSLLAQPRCQLIRSRRIGHGNHFGPIALDLPRQFAEIIAGSQRRHGKPLLELIHHRKDLAADRTRRTQDGKLLHLALDPYFVRPDAVAQAVTRGEQTHNQ